MNNIIIFGASGHAKVVIDIVEKERKYKIAGIVEKINSYECHDIFGYKILGTDEDVPTLISKHSIVGGIFFIPRKRKIMIMLVMHVYTKTTITKIAATRTICIDMQWPPYLFNKLLK